MDEKEAVRVWEDLAEGSYIDIDTGFDNELFEKLKIVVRLAKDELKRREDGAGVS